MVASTIGLIMNFTGKNVKFVTSHDYNGNLVFLNQIGEKFFFVFENQNGNESSGAVVYEGENEEGGKFQWLYAWSNKNGEYKAYTEIADSGAGWNWDGVRENLMKSGTTSHADSQNCVSNAVISQPQYAVLYQGIMLLKGGSKT